jgi:branched-chain amino acid transport system permease protein
MTTRPIHRSLLLILVMIFRPTGLIAFKEFDMKRIIRPKGREEGP